MLNKKRKIILLISTLLIVFGFILSLHESIHYRDIAFLPMSLGITILIVSTFVDVSQRKEINYGLLSILLSFAITLIILGIVIPLMYK